MSSTIRMRRSRSGRQVRTTTSRRRAVARQSMDRTSSPTTYSRSESNSLPCPRSSARCCPSSWRSRDSFPGRCRRLPNGGSTRTVHGTVRRAWRPASPSGPSERMVTCAARLSPRLVGVSVVVSTAWPAAGMRTRAWWGCAPALGGQASRMPARSVRRPALATVSVTGALCPSSALVSPARASWSGRMPAASATSAAIASSSSPFTASRAAPSRAATITSTPISAASAARPVRVIAARAPRQGRRRARHRPLCLPIRLPAAAAPGAAASAGPAP